MLTGNLLATSGAIRFRSFNIARFSHLQVMFQKGNHALCDYKPLELTHYVGALLTEEYPHRAELPHRRQSKKN